jgi:hypothetical protein
MEQENRDYLIIGMLLNIQAEVQATRDTILGMMASQYKYNDQVIEAIEAGFKTKLMEAKMAIAAKLKADKISESETIDELLKKLFPPS